MNAGKPGQLARSRRYSGTCVEPSYTRLLLDGVAPPNSRLQRTAKLFVESTLAPAVASTMQTHFIVRSLEFSDLEALLTLYTHLHRQDDPLPSLSEMEKIWGAILRDPGQIYLGAFVNAILVSACNATIVANLTRGARPYAIIENVVTDARFRRRKIGSAVLRQLLDRCWDRHCYKVMLMSSVSRSEIHAFYESLGFDKAAKQAFIITDR